MNEDAIKDGLGSLIVADQPVADTSTRPIPALTLDRMQLVPGIERPKKTVRYSSSEVDQLALDEILELVADGYGLATICSYSAHLPTLHIVRKWLEADSSAEARYRKAREQGADTIAESTLLIADTDHDATRASIRIKARQWLAERIKPAAYGNRVDVNINANINAEQQRAAAIERARSMRDQLGSWASQVIEGQLEKEEQPND